MASSVHGTMARGRSGFQNMKMIGSMLTVVATLVAFTASPRAATAPSLPPEGDSRRDSSVEAVARVMPSVVNIGTETVVEINDPYENLLRDFWGPYYRRRQPEAQYSLGSGVVIDESGYILTNEHVVRRATRIWVRFLDEAGGKTYEAERVAGTARSDVALLRVKAEPGERFPAVRFAGDDELYLGETVLALGNPFGLGGSVSRGILSSKSRRPPVENQPLDIADWLQTDAAINPGSSGGPLINLKGELMGLNVAVFREGQGIGFAIPIKRVTEALSQIFSPEIRELWFGARVRPGGSSLEVSHVDQGSPADKAGIRPRDVILTINGKTPPGFIGFIQELLTAEDKRDVTLELKRGKDPVTVTLKLIREASVFNAALVRQKLGLSVQEITSELADRLSLATTDGLLIAGVDRDSEAADAGLLRGHIILAIEDLEVNDVVSMAKVLYAKKKGEKISLELLAHRRRGAFIVPQRGSVKLEVR